MFSKRGTEQLTGVLLVTLVVGVVVALVTQAIPFADLDFSKDELRDDLIDIAKDSKLWFTSGAFAIFANLISIPMAAALYLTFRSHDRSLALFGSFGFLAAAVLELVRLTVNMALGTLAQDFAAASGAQADAYFAVARALSAVALSMDPLGSMAIALGIFAYGALIVRTQALPRWIGWIGVVGGAIVPLVWLTYIQQELIFLGFIGLIIGLFFAVTTGVRLVSRGTDDVATAEQTA